MKSSLPQEKVPAFILAVNRSNVFSNRSHCLVGGKSIIKHIADRLSQCRHISVITLCTSDKPEDNSLEELGKGIGIKVVRGEYGNVFSRLDKAFKELKCPRAFVVRGDTPFIDSSYCDKLYEYHRGNVCDYSYNEHLFGLPYGLGCEIVERAIIAALAKTDVPAAYRHSIGFYFRLNEKKFKIGKMDFHNPKPDLRYVVETFQDYDFARELHSLVGESFSADDLINCVASHQYLSQINKPISTPKEIGLEKLTLFPQKIQVIMSSDVDQSYPISVELSLTNECNQNCAWCSDGKIREKRPGAMSFEKFVSLARDLSRHGTKGIVFEGGGEPTLYPKFRDAVKAAIQNGLSVGLITNGVVFEYADLVPSMDWIRVSLDADTRESYMKWNGRDSFYDVLKNIKEISAIKERCVIGVGYVVTKYNIRHLEDITMLLGEYGVNYLYLRPVIDHPELLVKENLVYLKKYETDNFSVMIHAMDENTIKGNGNVPCRTHSLSSVILADGSVFLCGRLNIHDWIKPIGNICRSSFHSIWCGEKRKKQSAEVLNPDFCSKWCPECRLTKYNLVIDGSTKIRTRNFI